MRMVTDAKLFSGDVAHSLVITVLKHQKNAIEPPQEWPEYTCGGRCRAPTPTLVELKAHSSISVTLMPPTSEATKLYRKVPKADSAVSRTTFMTAMRVV